MWSLPESNFPSLEDYRSLADVVILALDNDANIVNISDFGLQILEYSKADLVGRSWLQCCVPTGHHRQIREVIRQFGCGKAQAEHHQTPVVSRSGQRYILAWHSMVHKNANGQVIGMLSSGIDLTGQIEEQIRAETELKDAKALTEAIIDNSAEGIINIDASGRIRTFNKAAENIFGYNYDEVLGENVRMLMGSPYREAHDGYIRHHLETNEQRVIGIGRELTARKKDGTLFPIHLSVSRITFLNQHFFVGTIRDISRQQQAEQLLRETELELHRSREQLANISRIATIGEMSSGIAHELNQPLTAIATYVQAIDRLLGEDSKNYTGLDHALEQIDQQVTQAAVQIRRLRGLAEQRTTQIATIDINRIIEETVSLTVPDIINSGLKLNCELSPALPSVKVDKVQIQQVLVNLIINAIQSMKDATDRATERHIVIRSRPHGNSSVKISVRDRGTGISPEVGELLFTPFFTTRKGGVGLGLQICRTLVSANGGTISYRNRKRMGSEFFFILPGFLSPDPVNNQATSGNA